MQKIEPKEEDPLDYQFQYYYTLYGLYNNWSTYCENNEFSKIYDQQKVEYPEENIRTVAKEECILLLPARRVLLLQQSFQQ